MSSTTDKTDAVTGWWRSLSLRAKVTGVAVSILALGLIATGIGTTVFLRSQLLASVDTQVSQLAGAGVSALFDIDLLADPAFVPKAESVPTDYFVAIYNQDGDFIASAGGGRQINEPDFPTEYLPTETSVTQQQEPFTIPGTIPGTEFRAASALIEVKGTTVFYTQMIAVPLTTVTQTLATYLGIYSILSVITIMLGAIAIRLLVTLAFRSLTQVENTAMEIAAGDFGQRMTDIAPATEVGRLKTAINAMLGRIDAALAQRDATVRQMRRFVGDASHELRTPLVTVRGYAELYRMGAIRTDHDVAQSMERIEKEAMRMGLLVEDLLALARLDERRDIEFAPVDLRPLARDAALDVRAASPQRPVAVIDTTIVEPTEPRPPQTETDTLETPKRPRSAFSRAGSILLRRRPRDARGTAPTTEQIVIGPLDLGPSSSAPVALPPIVLGEENRIRQVITNLIGNARRFTAEDSPIELRIGVDAAAQSGWIEIVDHGEGVPDQIKDKIFQRFWRADTSRTRETGGSGLGLSIVASIVESLHGSVRVMDTPGGGATFRVGFPLARHLDPADHAFLETQPLDRLPSDLRSDPPA